MKLPADLFQHHEGEIKEHVRWGGQETGCKMGRTRNRKTNLRMATESRAYESNWSKVGSYELQKKEV